ncbi:MAG: DUF92 domain-containing protein [archaeon]|nr:DUF92 domain-containing protein [archaeon]
MIEDILIPEPLTILSITIVSIMISGIAFFKKVLDQGGSALAFLVCFIIGTLGHWSWLLIMLIFVGSAFLATRFAIVYKKALGVEESDEGTRGGWNVISNGMVPAIVAIFYSLGFLEPEQALVAFATAVAAAMADTMASEIGVLSPQPVMITNPLEKVEPGTDGGVSLEGTIASLLSSVSISMLSFAAFLLLIEESHPFYSSFKVDYWYISSFFGFFGCVIDSLLGATLEKQGILDNNGVNFISISVAVVLSLLFLPLF